MGPGLLAEAAMSGRSLYRLTATQAAKLTKPGRHSDGGGLYLSIDAHGRKRWVFRHCGANTPSHFIGGPGVFSALKAGADSSGLIWPVAGEYGALLATYGQSERASMEACKLQKPTRRHG